MSEPTTVRGFRISLRELLVLFAAVAGGCAALNYANQWWQTAVGAVLLISVMASAVVALFDRGRRQARAIAFALFAAAYGLIVHSSQETISRGNNTTTQNAELDAYQEAKLPTTRLLQPLYGAVARKMWRNTSTDEIVRESAVPESDREAFENSSGYGRGGFTGTYGGVAVGYGGGRGGYGRGGRGDGAPAPAYLPWGNLPLPGHFMLVGHCLWALLLGYLGAKFAGHVYARRIRETAGRETP